MQYPSSKAALNMITAMYAKELRDTPIKVNAANPGFTATDLNDHRGFRSASEGAEPSVYLATLPDDGPNGIHWGYVWTTRRRWRLRRDRLVAGVPAGKGAASIWPEN